ncbi:MAG: hypothetical protein ACP5RG_06420 [Thermoplasmata archaeon]
MGYNGKNNLNQPLIYLNSSSLSKFFREPFILMHSSEKGRDKGKELPVWDRLGICEIP